MIESRKKTRKNQKIRLSSQKVSAAIIFTVLADHKGYLVAAAVFVVMSLLYERFFCRFLCPAEIDIRKNGDNRRGYCISCYRYIDLCPVEGADSIKI